MGGINAEYMGVFVSSFEPSGIAASLSLET